MTAKRDLIARLTALMPECAREIAEILSDFEVASAKVYDRSNLPRRVDAFLAAKRIDGCRDGLDGDTASFRAYRPQNDTHLRGNKPCPRTI